MVRATKLALLTASLAVAVVLMSLCIAIGDTDTRAVASQSHHRLRRPRFHYESDYLYIADAYMGPIRVGPNGYLYMRRQCSPWQLTVCPFASRMELSLLRG